MSKRGRGEIVNHYKTLEVRDDADEAEIKKAYRTLVLRWHPDKHRDQRAEAEEKIRLINSAYEVLSNPTKKDAYDEQKCTMEGGTFKKRKKVTPKVSFTKEFMLQPLGHPEKFVRCAEEKVSVESRQDSEVDFEEFFQGAKFSLWWLPEVNNACRIRALGSKAKRDKKNVGRGLAGGLNLAYKFTKANKIEAPISLSEAQKNQKNEAVNFIAVSSPEFEGAYRFEAMNRKGCFLSYTPPSRLGVINLENDPNSKAVLDFMPLDFTTMSKFIDLEEVFTPVMNEVGTRWVKVSQLQEHAKVKAFFETVLQKIMWDADDFASYFEGHWANWEYNAQDQCVRLRPSSEMLGMMLHAANNAAEAAYVISGAGDELTNLTLAEVERTMRILLPNGYASKESHGPKMEKRLAAWERLAEILPTMASDAAQQERVEIGAGPLMYMREQVIHLATASAKKTPPVAATLAELTLRVEILSAAELESLSKAALLVLALAATKLPAGEARGEKLGVVAKAATTQLSSWTAADIIQLLLLSAKVKQDMPADAKAALLQAAASALRPQLKELPSADVLKLVLGSDAELLVVAATEAVKRLSDFPQSQLLLLTQALTQGLGYTHAVVVQIMEFWTELLGESESSDKGLSADQLVRLAQVASLVSAESSSSETFPRLFESLGSKLMGCVQKVSASARSDLQGQLESDSGLGKFSRKQQLSSMC